MPLMPRVRAILRNPRATWPVIAGERASAPAIYTGYVMILAAIPALAGFIGLSLTGAAGLHVPIDIGLSHMLVSWLLSLLLVWIVAWAVDALAPSFGGSRNRIAALKLVAYGSTASFVGGIFNLVPVLAVLGLVMALYSIYLIYTGLPVLMQCPPAKAGAYTAAVVVCGIIAMLVLGAIATVIAPGTRLQPAAGNHATTQPSQPAQPALPSNPNPTPPPR